MLWPLAKTECYKEEKEKGYDLSANSFTPLHRAHMLALILYTGCDSNYAMCAAERDGDYETWKWFSWLLNQAVDRLYYGNETETTPVAYSGEDDQTFVLSVDTQFVSRCQAFRKFT